MRINYPFAAVPNQVFRSGVGVYNIAVLGAILSRGKCLASMDTIAKNLGCNEKSVRRSIKFWKENGKKYGIKLNAINRKGCTTILGITVEWMGGTPDSQSEGSGLTVRPTPDSQSDKEDYYKKITEEEEERKKIALDKIRKQLNLRSSKKRL